MNRLHVGRLAALGMLSGIWGCGSVTTPAEPTPTYTQITETYSGSLNVGETKAFHFTITNPGSLDAAITSLSPSSTLTMGLRLGAWDVPTESCPEGASNPANSAARVNVVVSGTPQSAGEYCAAIYDVGNVQTTTTFEITVQHY
jgi:hypothetical protein